MTADTQKARRARIACAAAVALVLAIVGAANVSMARSMGYDEAMHAELPAVRMLLAARMGEWSTVSETLLGCEQYPFVYPVVLALVQAWTGVSEFACRASGRVAWALALLGIFLVAERVVDAIQRQRAAAGAPPADESRARWTPWIAMGAAAASPMALAYSGTLFLEIPFVAIAVIATWLWLLRCDSDAPRAARLDIVAGAAIAAAFFTKFNYGVLLAAGFALDFALEGAQAWRSRAGSAWLKRAARLALVPAIALAWWFLLPLPAGGDTAASHRATFWSFLSGNQDFALKPFRARVFDWGAGLFLSPRALLATLFLCLVALRFLAVRELRTVAILALVLTLPVALHPYHLDRFLLPAAPYLFVLAAVGLGSLLPRAWPARLGAVVALAFACGLRADIDTARLADWAIPAVEATPEIAEYRRAVLAQTISLAPDRSVPSAGLERADSDAALDAFAAQAGRHLHIGWLAAPEKLPPCALHLGLLARGGPHERFLDDLAASMIFGVAGLDPLWDDAQLGAACRPFDVIFASEPADAFGPAKWAFLKGYRERLAAQGYVEEEFGPILLHPLFGKERSVKLFALRRTP